MFSFIKKTRSGLLELLTHKIALPLILLFRNKNQYNYSMEQLLTFQDGTLGKDLAEYLQKKDLYLIRGYLRHDCKHILLGYEMDEEGEARMQCYFLGNRHYSIPVVMTAIMCLLLMPDHWKKLYREFRKGRQNKDLGELDINKIISMNTITLRKQFGLSI